jgi:hypothetical protein
VLAAQKRDLVFTSNRAEGQGIFGSGSQDHLAKVLVGRRPNGLASLRNVPLVANVGDLAIAVQRPLHRRDARSMIATVPMPGRTRWAMF